VSSYTLTEDARQDLLDIWVFIAEGNPDAADRFEKVLLENCERVGRRPDIGHVRNELTSRPLRFFPVRHTYLIVYDPATQPVRVVRILHGALDAVGELEK
jgi:plasmid stabilization system protein ParE